MNKDRLKRLSIELSSKCNYHCAGCPTDSLIRGKGDIDSNLFFQIFREVGNDLERVFLWGYGEPLLHPDIVELLEFSGEYKCKKIMSTNGWKLEDFEDFTFLRNLDELIISINGFTPETYQKHQIGGDLSKVTRGIKKSFSQIRDYPTRKILQVVAHKENLNELEHAEEFARENDFDEIVLKSFNVMDGNQETFEKFVPMNTDYSRYNNPSPDKPSPGISGVYPCERWMIINWDGSVNPCCWDYSGRLNLGDINEQGVYGVWNSKRAQDQRDSIREKRFHNFCIDCSASKIISQKNLKLGDKTDGTKNI